MRQVTLLNLAQVEDPVVRAALQAIQDASADNIINDVASSGAALSTVKNATADEIAYYAGPTDVQLTAFTAFARSVVAAADAAALLAILGGSPGTYLQIAQNLADLANAVTARSNLGLGSSATHAASDFLLAANNLSDVTASTARTNLGLVIGTDVLGFDAQLFSNVPQNSQSTAYTTVLTDGEKHIYHPSADTTARTWTIDSNGNVPYPIGTAISFVNDTSAGVITLAITSDTLVWYPTGGTGSRTLTAPAFATALKIASTRWILTGVGIS